MLFHGCVVRVKMGVCTADAVQRESRTPAEGSRAGGLGGWRPSEGWGALRGWRHSESGGIQRVEAFRGVGAFRGWRPSEVGGLQRGGGLQRVEAFSSVAGFPARNNSDFLLKCSLCVH